MMEIIGMVEEYIARIGNNGDLELHPGIINRLLGKRVKVTVYPENTKDNPDDADAFIDFLRNSPKAESNNENMTREWIHSREADEL
jgi:hypothetical protein